MLEELIKSNLYAPYLSHRYSQPSLVRAQLYLSTQFLSLLKFLSVAEQSPTTTKVAQKGTRKVFIDSTLSNSVTFGDQSQTNTQPRHQPVVYNEMQSQAPKQLVTNATDCVSNRGRAPEDSSRGESSEMDPIYLELHSVEITWWI